MRSEFFKTELAALSQAGTPAVKFFPLISSFFENKNTRDLKLLASILKFVCSLTVSQFSCLFGLSSAFVLLFPIVSIPVCRNQSTSNCPSTCLSLCLLIPYLQYPIRVHMLRSDKLAPRVLLYRFLALPYLLLVKDFTKN